MRGSSLGPGSAGETAAGTAAEAPASPATGSVKGEHGAAAGARALGPDAAAVRLDEPLRDGEPEAVARLRALSRRGMLAEQVRQSLGRRPAPLVGDRDGDVRVLAQGRHRIGVDSGACLAALDTRLLSTCTMRRRSAITGAQPRGQLDEDGVPAAAAQERASRPLDQGGRHLGRERAGAEHKAASGTLSFEAGELSGTIEVGVLDDAHDEGEETPTLRLSNSSGGELTDGARRRGRSRTRT